MKQNLTILITFIMGVLFGIIFFGTYNAHTSKQAAPPEPEIRYVYVESDPVVETEYIYETVYVPYEEPFYRNLTEEDKYYLQDIAMREAEGEDVIGQLWVMYCVICRAEAFNRSIKEDVLSSDFKTSLNRAGLTPNDACNEALALIEEGWQPRPLNFRAGTYHDFRHPLCQVGNHYFSADF